jgi:hypothetical protein
VLLRQRRDHVSADLVVREALAVDQDHAIVRSAKGTRQSLARSLSLSHTSARAQNAPVAGLGQVVRACRPAWPCTHDAHVHHTLVLLHTEFINLYYLYY